MAKVERDGSLQAAQAIGSSIKTLLGPSCSLKCCIGDASDDNDSIICSCTIKILQYLDIKHPAWHIINDACDAMYKSCGSGCKTLVCMIGFWSGQIAALQRQGIPIPVITQLFDEALNECIKVLVEIAVPFEQIKQLYLDNCNARSSVPTNEEVIVNEHCEAIGGEMKNFTAEIDDNLLKDTLPKHNLYNMSKDMKDKDGIANHKEHGMDNQHGYEDEFDDCFDDPPINVSSKLSKPSLYNTPSGASQKEFVGSKPTANSNRMELKKTEEVLQKLSLLGLNTKCKQPKRNYSQIVFASRNLVPDTPKTVVPDTPKTVAYNVSSITETNPSHKSKQNGFNPANKENISILGEVLSHRRQREMKLAIEVIFAQIPQTETRLDTFEVDKNCINIESVFGPSSENVQAIDGILVKANSPMLKLPKLKVYAALVNGDITREFRHAGYKDSFKVKQVFNEVSYKNISYHGSGTWFGEVIDVIKKLKIEVIFCRGNIDKDVEEFCQACDIVIVSNISPKVLHLLSTSLGATMVVYFTDIKPSDISRPVNVHHWLLPGQKILETPYVIVKPDKSVCSGRNAQTVFLSSPSQQLLMESELAFWNCVSCIQNTINQGCVLPGGGQTELECIKRLRHLAAKSATEDKNQTRSSSWIKRSLPCYRQTVYSAFADGLEEFVTTLILNTGKDYSQAITIVDMLSRGESNNVLNKCEEQAIETVADDYLSKINAWRRAVGVVCILLQSDMIIQTGSGKN